MRSSFLLQILSALVFMGSLSSCVDLSVLPGLGKSGRMGRNSQVEEKNLELGALMNLAAQAKCTSCHSAGGAAGGTAFADPEESTAYNSFKRIIIDYVSPAESLLISKSQDGHFGGSALILERSAWEERVAAFVASEKKTSDDPEGPAVPPVILPEDLPAPVFLSGGIAADANVTRVVKTSVPVKISGIPDGLIIDLSVTGKAATGNIQRLSIVVEVTNNSNSALTISGLRLFQGNAVTLNAVSDYIPERGGSYFDVVKTLNAGEKFTYVSPPTIEFLQSKDLANGKFIGVGIQSAKVDTGKAPCGGPALGAFKVFVRGNGGSYPGVAVDCLGCHGPASARGFKIFTDDAQACANMLNYVNTGDVSASILLQRARRGISHGPGVIMDATDETFFVDWVNLFK